jgi:hypothetical protein
MRSSRPTQQIFSPSVQMSSAWVQALIAMWLARTQCALPAESRLRRCKTANCRSAAHANLSGTAARRARRRTGRLTSRHASAFKPCGGDASGTPLSASAVGGVGAAGMCLHVKGATCELPAGVFGVQWLVRQLHGAYVSIVMYAESGGRPVSGTCRSYMSRRNTDGQVQQG